jgi:pyruvate dehydrogenase E1 component
LIDQLIHQARLAGDDMPISATTPYINTIPWTKKIARRHFELEHRIRALTRWNAMAIVMNANKESSELGGHIASFASAATLYDVAFNHFFHGKTDIMVATWYISRATPRPESMRALISKAA